MRFATVATVTVALIATVITAAPAPKVNHVHYPHSPNFSSHHRRSQQVRDLTTNDVNVTSAGPTTKAPHSNIWISLTNDEAAGVIRYIHDQDDLNVTAVENATSWDNSVLVVDLIPPNKTDALAYFDGSAGAPARWAKATIMFGAFEEPYVQDIMVGPLPVSNETTWAPFNYASNKPGGSKIRVYDADYEALNEAYVNVSLQNADLVLDLLNITVNGTDSDDGEIWGIDPLWHETDDQGKDHTVTWLTWWRYPTTDFYFDGETLLPQGLFIKMDITGRDPSQWHIVGWLYNDIYYTSTEEFRAAWQSEGFEKLSPNYSGDWIGTDQAGEAMPFDDLPPPMPVQPGGQRFSVDVEEKYVEWMDWSFYITFTRDTGVRLFNIKYMNQTILYELGLNEAVAHYAGNDPVQSGTAYLDTYYGFGPYAFELIPGYDVPLYSTFLNSTFHAAEESITHRQSIAIFEKDESYPMQRHSSGHYVTATKNIALELRYVATVGNYDYSFSYVWYQDGSLETIVRASGYIQSAFPVKNEGYGYKIHDQLSGSMHDHALTFKADFDIMGTANTIAKHRVVAKDVKYPWSNATRSTMHLERSYIESEDEGKLKWGDNAGTMFMVVNKNETNKYGEERGYRIMPSKGGAGMYLTIQNSSNLINSQSFVTHDFYVIKRKDTELAASHPYNNYDTANPIIDFAKYFDGESLEQEDLVTWFNLGMHHVPHTGDLPNTVMTTATSGIIMTPHNYFDGSMATGGDPSRKTRQMIRINYGNPEGVQEVLTFGQSDPSGNITLSSIAWDPTSYAGDIAVRKFPYDPTNPYNETSAIV